MMADLWDAVFDLSQWTNGRAVVLRGANGVFCSGGDMDFVRHPAVFSHEGGRRMSLFMSTTLAALRALPLTSVALVERAAIGGGAELAGSTDLRVFTEDAIACYIQSTLSIAPGWGGTSRLVSLVGPTRALELLLSGRRITAREGLEIGYVQHIIPNPKSPKSATATSSAESSTSTTAPTSSTATATTTTSASANHETHNGPLPSTHGTSVDPVLGACLAWLERLVGGTRRPEVVRAVKSTVHMAEETAFAYEASQLQLDEMARFSALWSTPAHRKSIDDAMSAIQSKPKSKSKSKPKN